MLQFTPNLGTNYCEMTSYDARRWSQLRKIAFFCPPVARPRSGAARVDSTMVWKKRNSISSRTSCQDNAKYIKPSMCEKFQSCIFEIPEMFQCHLEKHYACCCCVCARAKTCVTRELRSFEKNAEVYLKCDLNRWRSPCLCWWQSGS